MAFRQAPGPNSQVLVGKKVPDFSVESFPAGGFQLAKQVGKTIILYFYPKDDTPGCTLEGHDFNRLQKQFANLNTVIYGISRDSVKSHEKFINKCGYRFPLLSDPSESVCQLFAVIKEKNMYGKKVFGIERSTFIIGPDQKLIAEFRKLKAEGHAEDMLKYIQDLN